MRLLHRFGSSLLLIFTVGILLVAGEIAVRLIKPRAYMYPRWEYSRDYGSVLYKNTTMVQELPGKWKYEYQINEYGYRGPAVPISNAYDKKNILILGDSYSFGHGVCDGEEYAAVMRSRLQDNFNVINLAVGSYGLTQEIRRFYEFGQLYMPSVVFLQFCGNDLDDNLFNRVTEIKDGRFVFHPTNNPIGWTKIFLSHSVVQKSQLYNLFRDSVYRFFRKRTIVNAHIDATPRPDRTRALDIKETRQERYYNQLLDLFARDLHRRGISLVMIAVNNQLDWHPSVRNKVMELDAAGDLRYIEVAAWFETLTDYGSPEGHDWGAKAHQVIGEHLADYVIQNFP